MVDTQSNNLQLWVDKKKEVEAKNKSALNAHATTALIYYDRLIIHAPLVITKLAAPAHTYNSNVLCQAERFNLIKKWSKP